MMKAICEMSIEELAEYVVKITGVDWGNLLGASMKHPPRHYGDLGQSRVLGVRQADRVEVILYEGAWWVPLLDCRLDLNDPATFGCLLAMARAKISRWFYVEPCRGGGGYVGKVPFMGAPPVTENMPTEVHVLVAALAKEV